MRRRGWAPAPSPAASLRRTVSASWCIPPTIFCIADNFIGDYQATKTMLAAIGGTWGPGGVCTGNYYGPRINTRSATSRLTCRLGA